jgi:hypothetical protein
MPRELHVTSSTKTAIPESHRDLLQTDVAVLSTVGADLRKMDRPGESRAIVTLHPVRVNANPR